MFNSTVRKCSETPACVRVASGLLPIVLALAAAQLAYPQSQPIATILQGQLLTSKGVPVAGATVQWSLVGAPSPSQTGVTDSAGNFAFEIPLSITTQVQLATIANLYTATQTTVQLPPGTTTQVQVKLTRRPAGQYGAVYGAVRNSAGLVIPYAAVSIVGAGGFLSTTTDANGKFKFTPVGFNSNLTLQASTANPYPPGALCPAFDVHRCKCDSAARSQYYGAVPSSSSPSRPEIGRASCRERV